MADLELVKKLREETGISISDCKKALDEAGGDIEKAKEVLRKRGQVVAAKKADRQLCSGIIDVYLHPNRQVGVLLELSCETDFVAKSDDFKNLAHELCLQVASMKPIYVKEEDIPLETIEKEKEIYLEQIKGLNKPQDIAESIVKGKLEKFAKEVCLMPQAWIKDDSKTINSLVTEYIAKIGENIAIKKFIRYEI